jgi:hypothetical protein
MRDEAARHKIALERARADYADTTKKLADLTKSINDGVATQDYFDSARQREKDASDRAAKLEKIWADASASTRNTRAGLDALQSQPAPVKDDSELQQMTARLKQLTDALEAARSARGGDTTKSAAAVVKAQTAYQQQLDNAKTKVPQGSPLGDYLDVAQRVATAIARIDDELAERERLSSKTISDLHGTIAEKIQAHLKLAWAGDPQLKILVTNEQAQERRLGTALATPGATAEVKEISARLEIAKAAVATRRDQIAISANYPDEIKKLEQLASDQTDLMAADRARSDQRIAEQFKLLAAATPAPGTLPDDQQKLMDGLVDSLVEVKNARQQLAMASVSSADVKPLEAESTELKAQIEARRRELADAAANPTPVVDSPAIVKLRAALLASQQAEARAFSDWTNSKVELTKAQADLDRLQSTQPDLVRDRAEYAAAETRLNSIKQQIDQESAFVPVIPVDPDRENSIQIANISDQRQYAEMGIGSFFLIGSIALLIRGGRHRSRGASSKDISNNAPPELTHEPLTAV